LRLKPKNQPSKDGFGDIIGNTARFLGAFVLTDT
jgi:hypothetical protein